ncbi:MAG: penicillin-binding protein 2 [Candidatus Omnitrophica bacterium]|nr:penicillin-binding protein 2 [Candidatus Omnitrophota bacterium]
MRHRQALIVFRILFIILVLGLFYIQIIQGDYFYNLSEKNIIRVVALDAARGKILDRNGIVLADSIPSFNISVIPQEVKNKTDLFSKLSKLLKVPDEKFKKNYKRNYLNSFIPVKIFEKLSKDKIIAVEEHKLQLQGVVVDIQPQRFYPFSNIASHVLGYLGQIDISRITKLKPYGYDLSDLMGYSGIEEYYDLVLRGEKGGEQIEVDSRGERVRIVGYKPPKSGQDIQITIDIRIQEIIDKFMQDNRGVVVIMDPYTGEIIALSNHPNYDPNDFIKGRSDVINNLLKGEYSPLFNRAISGQYPAGSVFKVVTATAALEKNYSLINKSFICNGKMLIGERNYNCWSVHEKESLRDAMVHSCNIYFYNLGMLIGPEAINKYAYRLGLGKATGIDLNYEARGFISSPNWKKIIRFQNWYKGDTANMSIGQGDILVTPIQITRMISVFINGGKLVKPHLIKSVGHKSVKIGKDKIARLNKGVLNNISSYLYEAVEDPEGTAHITNIEGLKIYGKTGTAQISGDESHGWFVGYAGRDKPKYAFCVFLENGGSGFFACVVAKKILSEMFNQDLI